MSGDRTYLFGIRKGKTNLQCKTLANASRHCINPECSGMCTDGSGKMVVRACGNFLGKIAEENLSVFAKRKQ